jgi:hypothetical protein
VAKKSGRGYCQTIDLEGSTIAHESQFLSENLVIFPTEGRGPRYSFMLTRSRGALAEHIAEYLRQRLSSPPAAVETLAPEPVTHI